MDDLIEALTIFRKYSDKKYPTHCEHDTLYVCGVPCLKVSQEDTARLKELGFFPDSDDDELDDEGCIILTEYSDTWTSYRFGSC